MRYWNGYENYKGTWTWAKNYDGKPFWSLVDDPSLRKGIELVSCKMTQVKTKAALVAAQKAINLMKLTSASRCGVHVHVNMLNLTWGQMWSFMALYTFMEPEIFAKFAPERHDNHFCVPMAWNTKLAADLGRDIDMLRSFNVGDIDYTQPDRGYRPGKGMGLQAPHNIQFTAQTDPAGQMETAAPPMYTGGNNKRWFPLPPTKRPGGIPIWSWTLPRDDGVPGRRKYNLCCARSPGPRRLWR